MPTPTYTPIANTTIGTAVNSVTFSSISGVYRDLVLVVNWGNSATTGFQIRFNSDTASNYSYVIAQGDGTTKTNLSSSSANVIPMGYVWNPNTVTGNSIINIMDYSATDKHKTVLLRDNETYVGTDMIAARWASTSAITSIQVFGGSSSNFTVGSTLALYGIAS